MHDNNIRAIDYTYTPILQGTGGMSGKLPPDLPSWLLDKRILFIGLPIVDQVVEIVISELLYLNYMMPKEPVYVLLSTIGNQEVSLGRTLASDYVSFAAYDTMMHIRPEKRTFVLGGVSSTGTLLAVAGAKGHRYGFPEASLIISPPRVNRTAYEASDALSETREQMNKDREYFDIIAQHSGRDRELLRRAFRWNGYFYTDQAIQWGFLDKVVKKGARLGGASLSRETAPRGPRRGGYGGGQEIAPAADA